jgi:hypothetical protein
MKWEIIASDYNSPFFRNHLSVGSFFLYSTELDLPIPKIGIISNKKDLNYFADIPSWDKTHEELKSRALKDYNYVEKLIDKTNSLGEEFNKWSKKNIQDNDLKNLNSNEIIKLITKFIDYQKKMYMYGTTLPILDFHSFSFVEGNLEKYLKEKCSKEQYQEYYSLFTEPKFNSFSQDQEEDLLRLMKEFYSEDWKKDILEKNISEIESSHKEFYAKLQKHTKKHCWVYYVYAGPAFKEKQFLEFIKDYLESNINPTDKLEKIKNKKQEIADKKEKAIKEFEPDEFNLAILNLAGKMVWAKPRRKDYQSQSYYHMEKMVQREKCRQK